MGGPGSGPRPGQGRGNARKGGRSVNTRFFFGGAGQKGAGTRMSAKSVGNKLNRSGVKMSRKSAHTSLTKGRAGSFKK